VATVEEEGTSFTIKNVTLEGLVTLEFTDKLDLVKMNNFTNSSFVHFHVVKNLTYTEDLESNGFPQEIKELLLNRNVTVNNTKSEIVSVLPSQI